MTTTAARELLGQDPYLGYTYAYPHKTAYGSFAPRALSEVWAGEAKDSLFLYLHIPFCEMRCGFCNLFTTIHPPAGQVAAYLDQLEAQARQAKAALGPSARFARLAIGGGTPTYLEAGELERLLALVSDLGADLNVIPSSIESSPATATPDRLKVLAEAGIERLSIGIQSFIEAEVHSVGRAQKNPQVFAALDAIRAAGLPRLNIDLIYGLAHQTPASWLESLQTALRWQPEEIFLYPLYVRPLTGIARNGRSWSDERLELYGLGRDFLLAAGYEQVSMRFFRRAGTEQTQGPAYCCQQDGMLGLGCGARSYTHKLHYASEYAVSQTGVKAILREYLARDEASFAQVDYGFLLDDDTRRRRDLLQSLLHRSGLDAARYRARFSSAPEQDFPQLQTLAESGLAGYDEGIWKLSPAGLAWSDAIGPWLYAPNVNERMLAYALH